MLPNWLVQLGDRNPQLLREVKGRFKRRSVLVTVAVSLLAQFLTLGYYWRMSRLQVTPDWIDVSAAKWMRYGETIRADIIWRGWCFGVFNTLTWIMFLLLLVLGSYLLLKDIVREERRGTLDFVRLSPESSHSVLIGKLLGVPSLVYLAIALFIPLHLWATVNAGVSLAILISVYLFAAVSCGFIYSFTLLHGLSWGTKAQFWYILLPIGIHYLLPLGPYWYWGYKYREMLQHRWTDPLVDNQAFLVMTGVWSFLLLVPTISLWRMSIYRFRHPPLKQ